MKIDFATLAFGYTLKVGGGTPNWATSLGQGKDYKINEDEAINELLKGMIFNAVSTANVSSRIGKGGKIVTGNSDDSPILIGSLFNKVYVNDTLVKSGKYIILITRDNSSSHCGRLRLKYGPSNSYSLDEVSYANSDFWYQFEQQFNLTHESCYFVYDISVRNQDELMLRCVIVDSNINREYLDSKDLHSEWTKLIKDDLGAKMFKESYKSCVYTYKDEPFKPYNLLLYGVPGSGKSYTIEHDYCDEDTITERLVFHPDYTYSDFVGQILPTVDDNGQVRYEFTPGPFTRILKEAVSNPDQEYILIIEEINRGNAPAIFGEIFQLLDRKTEEDESGIPVGASEYGIINADIAKIVYDDLNHEVRIPSNLSIIGTMNTSDQNVFTLDTAFQRRWAMRLVENSFDDVDPSLAEAEILDTGVTWKTFNTIINDKISESGSQLSSSEDKRLGVYFVKREDILMDSELRVLLENNKSNEETDDMTSDENISSKIKQLQITSGLRQHSKFAEKVIKYLWDDAFKFNREELFNTTDYKNLEDVINSFMTLVGPDRFKIFNYEIYDNLISR